MRIFFWVFIIALFSLILAVERVEERRLGAEVSRLEQEVSLKEAENQYTKYKIEVLTSPSAVDEAARTKLNMSLTPVKNITVMKDEN